MNALPSYLAVATFGTSASVVQPDATTYANGYLPGAVLPAQHENWFMNRMTSNENTLMTQVANIQAELNNLLANYAITPDGSNVQIKNLFSGMNSTHGFQLLTSGTSWTVPTGVYTVSVITVGGGGSGANAPNTSGWASGSGGGGGAINRTIISTTPGASIAYSIAASGGTTTFTGAASSGPGGNAAASGNAGPQLGGVAGGGNYPGSQPGAPGSCVLPTTSVAGPGGNGGNSWGPGGRGGLGAFSGPTNGSVGTYGGGGGGGGSNGTATGAAGGAGCVVLEY